MKTPENRKCVYCGKPVSSDEPHIAAKSGRVWQYAHSDCAKKGAKP